MLGSQTETLTQQYRYELKNEVIRFHFYSRKESINLSAYRVLRNSCAQSPGNYMNEYLKNCFSLNARCSLEACTHNALFTFRTDQASCAKQRLRGSLHADDQNQAFSL